MDNQVQSNVHPLLRKVAMQKRFFIKKSQSSFTPSSSEKLFVFELFFCWTNELFTFSSNTHSMVQTSNLNILEHSEAENSVKSILFSNMH